MTKGRVTGAWQYPGGDVPGGGVGAASGGHHRGAVGFSGKFLYGERVEEAAAIEGRCHDIALQVVLVIVSKRMPTSGYAFRNARKIPYATPVDALQADFDGK